MYADCPSMDEWHRSVRRDVFWPVWTGVAVLLACALGFGLWASVAPLAGAVIASGSFVAAGQNKQVQHFEGGILREILAAEGDLVEANQVLVRLDTTAARAKLQRLAVRQKRLAIMRARLEAEIDGRETFAPPPHLGAAATEPETQALYRRQKIEMEARRKKRAAEIEVLKAEIAGLEESIGGYLSQVEATKVRLALFTEELKDKASLLDRQLARKTDVLAVRRAEAGLSGELGELMGRVADSRERIARANQQIAQLTSAGAQKAIEELRETETELDDVDEQLNAARDVVERTEVRAPVRGVVVKLNHHTAGGVVAPGEAILELLPVKDELIIEARVAPNDIANVRLGQEALVKLTALNQRSTPMIAGTVVYRSADSIKEQLPADRAAPQQPGHDSFVVRVEASKADLEKKVAGFIPTPGLPAEIFIKTGDRTFFEYLFKPVIDSFARAFREG